MTDTAAYVSFLDPGPVDLNGDGGVDIAMFESGGGENGAVSVWTWHDGALVLAAPAEGSPVDLATATRLSSGSEEIGVASQDGKLFSWQVVEPGGHEVHVWRWALSGATLTATEQPGTRCVERGVLKPC